MKNFFLLFLIFTIVNILAKNKDFLCHARGPRTSTDTQLIKAKNITQARVRYHEYLADIREQDTYIDCAEIDHVKMTY